MAEFPAVRSGTLATDEVGHPVAERQDVADDGAQHVVRGRGATERDEPETQTRGEDGGEDADGHEGQRTVLRAHDSLDARDQ